MGTQRSNDLGERTARQHAPRSVLRVVLLAVFGLAFLLPLIGNAGLALAQSQAAPRVTILHLDNTVTPIMAQYLGRGISDAGKRNDAAVVIVMDTPGGLSSAMDDIIRDILQSDVPVVVYVSPRGARAASAGVYITYAAHIAAMAPGTNIGSASPVLLSPTGQTSSGQTTEDRKVTNDAVAQIRNLAALRGRNADWAEQAVRQAVNITADQALQEHVIDVVAPDLPTLLNDIDGRQVTMANGQKVTLHTAAATTSDEKMSVLESFLQLISDPTIAYLLMSFGALGIFLELTHPGAIVPGVVGALGLLLGLYALGTMPVNWTGALLILLAVILFAAELFVTSFGVLMIGGLISFIIGSYLLINSNQPGYTGISRYAIWAIAACIVAFAFVLSTFVLKVRFRKPETGKPALIDAIGVVRVPLRPTGMVFLQGELWTATAPDLPAGQEIPKGSDVVVTEVEGLRLIVRPATAMEASAEARVEAAERAQPRGASVIPVRGGVNAPVDTPPASAPHR